MDSFLVAEWLFKAVFFLFVAAMAFIIVRGTRQKQEQELQARGGAHHAKGVPHTGKDAKASVVHSDRQPAQHPVEQYTKVFFLILAWFSLPPLLLLAFFIGAGITMAIFGEGAPLVEGGFVFVAAMGIGAMLLFKKRLLRALGIQRQEHR